MSETTVGIHDSSCWSFLRSFRYKRWRMKAQRRIIFEEITESGVSSDRISGLPDELVCHILSYLTLRDSVRSSLLSRRWRHLCDRRSVLHFDVVNVFGFPATRTEILNQPSKYANQPSKYARVVDHFIQVRTGLNNVDEVKIQFPFDDVVHIYTSSRIDGWVRSFVRMGVKVLEVNQFISGLGIWSSPKRYVLSSSLLYSGPTTSYLKCLRLRNCWLTLSVGHNTMWISRLTTLDLSSVHMKHEEMECVLSSALNLTSLRLIYCRTNNYSSSPRPHRSINVELPKLKKLVVAQVLDELVLNCPNLEMLDVELCSVKRLIFSDGVPLLRQVDLGWINYPEYYPQNLDTLTRHAPNLQALSLVILADKVHYPIHTNEMICGLKRVEVELCMHSNGFDMCTIVHIMSVCPSLEVLHLKLKEGPSVKESPQTECTDRPHFHLKEVKIDGRTKWTAETLLVQYLLKNAVVLRRLVLHGVPFLAEKKSQDLSTVL